MVPDMSEPVTNVAIEDVLSSIRRLVSEDGRVRPLPKYPQQERLADYDAVDNKSAPDSKVEKLVLTPALRVAEDDGAQDPVVDQDSSPLQHDEIDADTASLSDEAVSHDDGRVNHDLAAQDDAVLDDAAVQVADGGAADAVPDPDWSDDVPLTTEDVAHAIAWEDHSAEPAPESSQAEEDDQDTFLADIMDIVGSAADTPATEPAEQDHVTQGYETQDDHEAPEHSAQDGSAGDHSSFVFASVRDDSGAIGRDAGAYEDEPVAHSLFDEDDTFLDEEMLRELVTDIVRQELQGALGERITRNVRKLVRREIHRALSSHELD